MRYPGRAGSALARERAQVGDCRKCALVRSHHTPTSSTYPHWGSSVHAHSQRYSLVPTHAHTHMHTLASRSHTSCIWTESYVFLQNLAYSSYDLPMDLFLPLPGLAAEAHIPARKSFISVCGPHRLDLTLQLPLQFLPLLCMFAFV